MKEVQSIIELEKYTEFANDSLYKEFRAVENSEAVAVVQSKIHELFNQFIDWPSEEYGHPIRFKTNLDSGVYSIYVRDGILRMGADERALHEYEIFGYLYERLFN